MSEHPPAEPTPADDVYPLEKDPALLAAAEGDDKLASVMSAYTSALNHARKHPEVETKRPMVPFAREHLLQYLERHGFERTKLPER